MEHDLSALKSHNQLPHTLASTLNVGRKPYKYILLCPRKSRGLSVALGPPPPPSPQVSLSESSGRICSPGGKVGGGGKDGHTGE